MIDSRVSYNDGYETLIERKHITVAGLDAYEATFAEEGSSGNSLVSIYLIAGQDTYSLSGSTPRVGDEAISTTQFEFLESILYTFDPGPDAVQRPCR